MKKLSKIKLIEIPKKSLLNQDEMSNIVGGESEEVCISYETCTFATDYCSTYEEDALCNGKTGLLCDSYVATWF